MTARRSLLALALLAALPGAARAQGRARREEALPLPPPPPPGPAALHSDLAPMPNRSFDPRGAPGTTSPSLQPDLINPPNSPGAIGSSGFVTQQDQLFREPAPGLRLRVPLVEEPIRR